MSILEWAKPAVLVGVAEGRLEWVAEELYADAGAADTQRETSAQTQCQQGRGEDQLGSARTAEECVAWYIIEEQ